MVASIDRAQTVSTALVILCILMILATMSLPVRVQSPSTAPVPASQR